MGNTLKMDKRDLIERLFKTGWSNRKVNRTTGINRRTLSKYRKDIDAKRTISETDDDHHIANEQHPVNDALTSQNAPLMGDSKCPPGQEAHFEVPTDTNDKEKRPSKSKVAVYWKIRRLSDSIPIFFGQ